MLFLAIVDFQDKSPAQRTPMVVLPAKIDGKQIRIEADLKIGNWNIDQAKAEKGSSDIVYSNGNGALSVIHFYSKKGIGETLTARRRDHKNSTASVSLLKSQWNSSGWRMNLVIRSAEKEITATYSAEGKNVYCLATSYYPLPMDEAARLDIQAFYKNLTVGILPKSSIAIK